MYEYIQEKVNFSSSVFSKRNYISAFVSLSQIIAIEITVKIVRMKITSGKFYSKFYLQYNMVWTKDTAFGIIMAV